MNWAGITVLVLHGASLLFYANLHGKERTGKHNFLSGLISTIIMLVILYFAGTFS